MRKVAVIGADMKRIGRYPEMMLQDLGWPAIKGAIDDAGLKRDDIQIALRLVPMPDLILLDVHLPDADGFDILARMRQHPVLKSMPVIMLTGETTREAVLKGLKGGADGYVTKPFEADVLVAAVKAVLGLTPAPGGPEPVEAKK